MSLEPNYIYIKSNKQIVAKLLIPSNIIFDTIDFIICDNIVTSISNNESVINLKLIDNTNEDLIHITNIYKEDI